MNSQDYRNLQEAYLNVYQELDEVRGGGKIDPFSDIPSIRERGARSSEDAGMLLSPLKRAKARVVSLISRGTPEATRRANQINSRFIRPTDSAVNRALLAATNAKHAEKTRLMKSNEQVDLYDLVLSHLFDEGYADTIEAAEVMMVNMSEEWRESIVEEVLDEAYVDYRKGKLPSGRTPQQSLNQGIDRNTKKQPFKMPSADDQDLNARAKQAKSVGKEMDAHTSFGGKIMKALSPGLGNRTGAAPRVAYGEPNTRRHQLARYRRGESSTRD